MVNIVIPMAGEGRRFKEAGYKKPKPFIDVFGKLMVERVIENINIKNAHFILIGRRDHLQENLEEQEYLKNKFRITFIEVPKLTEGTACTVLFARKFIANDLPLMIANSDQIVDINISKYFDDMMSRSLDGSILTFIDKERNPKWSFAKIDHQDLVLEVKEKEAISEYATVGIYLFNKGNDFVDSAISMIIHNDRVNNEFYTCPVYNYAIREGKKIGIYNMNAEQMHGTGTPEDLRKYLALIS